MSIFSYRHIAIFILMLVSLTAVAQDNDKILNRQYADMKRLHYGFSVPGKSGGPIYPTTRRAFASMC